jgi:hypothetical protein
MAGRFGPLDVIAEVVGVEVGLTTNAELSRKGLRKSAGREEHQPSTQGRKEQ